MTLEQCATQPEFQHTDYRYASDEKNPKAQLVLKCECGRTKTLFTDPIIVRQRYVQTFDPKANGNYRYRFAVPTITVPLNRLDWHCQHEDEQ